MFQSHIVYTHYRFLTFFNTHNIMSYGGGNDNESTAERHETHEAHHLMDRAWTSIVSNQNDFEAFHVGSTSEGGLHFRPNYDEEARILGHGECFWSRVVFHHHPEAKGYHDHHPHPHHHGVQERILAFKYFKDEHKIFCESVNHHHHHPHVHPHNVHKILIGVERTVGDEGVTSWHYYTEIPTTITNRSLKTRYAYLEEVIASLENIMDALTNEGYVHAGLHGLEEAFRRPHPNHPQFHYAEEEDARHFGEPVVGVEEGQEYNANDLVEQLREEGHQGIAEEGNVYGQDDNVTFERQDPLLNHPLLG